MAASALLPSILEGVVLLVVGYIVTLLTYITLRVVRMQHDLYGNPDADVDGALSKVRRNTRHRIRESKHDD